MSLLFKKKNFFFWPSCTVCGILVPRPGITPAPPALEAQSLNYWTAREVPTITVYILYLHLLQDINQE